MPRYVALLRGINVGGKTIVSMPVLKQAFVDAGYGDVSTYINSGNVIFSTRAKGGAALERKLEEMIEATFAMPIPVLVRSHDELAQVVASAPDGFGGPDLKSDVWFLKHPMTAAEAMPQLPALAEGIDRVYEGPGVIYATRDAENYAKSKQSKIVGTAIYKQMSIRNWNTTTKLLRMLGS